MRRKALLPISCPVINGSKSADVVGHMSSRACTTSTLGRFCGGAVPVEVGEGCAVAPVRAIVAVLPKSSGMRC